MFCFGWRQVYNSLFYGAEIVGRSIFAFVDFFCAHFVHCNITLLFVVADFSAIIIPRFVQLFVLSGRFLFCLLACGYLASCCAPRSVFLFLVSIFLTIFILLSPLFGFANFFGT